MTRRRKSSASRIRNETTGPRGHALRSSAVVVGYLCRLSCFVLIGTSALDPNVASEVSAKLILEAKIVCRANLYLIAFLSLLSVHACVVHVFIDVLTS